MKAAGDKLERYYINRFIGHKDDQKQSVAVESEAKPVVRGSKAGVKPVPPTNDKKNISSHYR